MSNDGRNYKVGQKRLDNLDKIFEAAELEFAQFGFKGTSMVSIARRAGIPRPNVHYYYKNKQALYNALLMRLLDLWNSAIQQMSAEDNPARALGGYIHAKVMLSKTYPLASKIFANEIIQGAPNLKTYLSGEFRDWLNGKARVIQQWIDEGKMDAVDPLHLIFLIWSSTQHYADFSTQVTAVMGKKALSDEDFEAVAQSLTHIILKGCGLTS